MTYWILQIIKTLYTDVVVHGNPNTVAVKKNGDWVELDHRRLAKFLKSDSGCEDTL